MSELWYNARNPPADPKDLGQTYKDKTVIVTGAFGESLGANAAIKYADLGANPLILATRTAEKGELAKSSIIQKTGCSPDIFIIEPVDLGSYSSIKAFAERVNSRVPFLHVLQLAGGIAPWYYTKTDDGHETSVEVDLLGTLLLALLMLPNMRATAAVPSPKDGYRPHISFLDSIAIFEVPETVFPSGEQTLIQRCDDEKNWDPIASYFLLRLGTWYAVQGLADMCTKDDSKIVINATCPGLCNTNMTRSMPIAYKCFMAIRYFFLGRSSEMGARTLVSATGLGPESHGKLYTNDKYHELDVFLKSERSDRMYRETWGEMLSILKPHLPAGIM